ncbi:MAG: DUF3375 domain-containing protein [Cocleimonas sp.]|nr:DUF3375 domain-containing protein [Cocleimonas sp.]
MNKLATISLVTVLGVAGGGAYMAMNPDKASEFAQYIPEPVTGLMNEYLPEDFKPAFLTQNTIVETEEFVEEQGVSPQQDESVVFQDNQNEEEQAQEAAEEVVANSMEEVNDEQDVMNVAMDEIQDALGKELAEQTSEPVDAVSAVKKEVSNNPKAVKIEQKIDGINAEISKLDSENEQLKDRFQQILKKNRELAEQLKAIDEQLTATN